MNHFHGYIDADPIETYLPDGYTMLCLKGSASNDNVNYSKKLDAAAERYGLERNDAFSLFDKLEKDYQAFLAAREKEAEFITEM